jgi:pyruvyltransferase
MGNDVPDVYGDPALLVPQLWSDSELGICRRTGGTVLVPNYHDVATAPPDALDPRGDLFQKIREIASAKRVVASSLHGIIIAEAYGVPAVLVASTRERPFKYEDYYCGTGRPLPAIAANWRSALEMAAPSPIDNWDAQKLLRAFPTELWSN